jgi:hypothetical protein
MVLINTLYLRTSQRYIQTNNVDSKADILENIMGDSNSLLNLGDLTKPATVLIEKISDAIGGIYKPYQIVRVTKAEVVAEKLRAEAQVEITELQRRAMARFFNEEAMKQNNMEAITSKALPEITEQARPDQIENDWIAHFFDKCRLISDEQMQSLWARILAGQANSPGSYSKRTIEILSYLEKADAIMFSQLCSFVFEIADKYVPLIYDTDLSIYTDHGINFMSISHLENLGLIQYGAFGKQLIELEQKGYANYFSNKVWYEFLMPERNELYVGEVLFTKSGEQLAPISGAQPIAGFFDYVKGRWKNFGLKTEQYV